MTTFNFECPSCSARIKAPVELCGQRRACPSCKRTLLVPHAVPDDAGPMLVLLEESDRYTLSPWQRSVLNDALVRN
jgi:hypothetical protein